MRVTLVGTGIAKTPEQGGGSHYNLANAYLDAYVRRDPMLAGSVELTRLEAAYELGAVSLPDDLVDAVVASRPDVVGLSCYAWDTDAMLDVGARVRDALPGVRLVAGGPSVSYQSVELLTRQPALDVVVRGEGEVTFAELLRRGFDRIDGLAGTTWRARGGEVREEPLALEPVDLATLPSPLLDGLIAPPDGDVLLSFSRGCVYKCKHCAWRTHGNGLRFVPGSRVRDEIAWVRSHACPRAFIVDSAINYDDEWLRALTEAIREADPAGDVSLSYFLDYRTITEEQARLLARIPTYEAALGLESVNPRALRAAGRHHDVVDEFTRSVEILADVVGPQSPSVMLGMPGDDLAGFRATLDFLAALADKPGKPRIRNVRVNWMIVTPGSHFATHAARHGIEIAPRGVPYLLGSDSFPREDLLRALDAIVDHPRADLFMWEDAEPARILAERTPRMTEAGAGSGGGVTARRIDDAEVLHAMRPLAPGRPMPRGWSVAGIERQHGFPIVSLVGPGSRRVSLQLRPLHSAPAPLQRTAALDLVVPPGTQIAPPGTEERRLLDALVDLFVRNAPGGGVAGIA